MASKLVDKDLGYRKLKRASKRKPYEILIGFQTEEYALIALVNEYGSPSRNIPERSFIRSTLAANDRTYTAEMERIALLSLEGKNVKAELKALSERIRKDIIQTIKLFSSPSNAESTVERKGFDNPLVDTGGLQEALVVEIV